MAPSLSRAPKKYNCFIACTIRNGSGGSKNSKAKTSLKWLKLHQSYNSKYHEFPLPSESAQCLPSWFSVSLALFLCPSHRTLLSCTVCSTFLCSTFRKENIDIKRRDASESKL